MPGLNIILLGLACAMAFARPVWGFGIILLLTSTLFHLDRYLTVPLPLGFIEPLEALLTSMLVALWLRNDKPSSLRFPCRTLAQDSRMSSIRYACSAIGPYCWWQILCILVGLGYTIQSESTLRFGLRFLLSGVYPWLGLYILARLSIDDGQKVFKTAYHLALLTACIHILIQLTDSRSVMNAAYFWVPENSEYDLSWMQKWVEQETFVRGLPQGIALILFFALLKMAEYVFASGHRRLADLTAAAVLFSALFITVTRSLIIVLAAGVIILLSLAFLTLRMNMVRAARTVGVFVFLAGAAMLYDVARPGFLDYWSQRINKLSGADSQILSEENMARGVDNIAAIRAIGDHPVFGLGTSRAPSEYSLRNGPPTDTHPMLTIGIVGGIPAMLLIVLTQVRLFLPSLSDVLHGRFAGNELLPFVSIMLMSTFALNLSGGGGTIYGAQILYVVIFATEMWNRRLVTGASARNRVFRLRRTIYDETTPIHLNTHPFV
jgi:hypothetical protein